MLRTSTSPAARLRAQVRRLGQRTATALTSIASMFAAGKRFLIQRAQHTKGSSVQPTIKEATNSAVRSQVDRLLARAAHEQGNIPDKFWQNKSLRKALRLLTEAKPMNYTAPCRKRIGGALRLEVFAEVNAAVEEVCEDCNVFTGSSDGWDNVSNTHFLSQMGMPRKGSFFKGGDDCTGVETMNKPWVFKCFYCVVWTRHSLKML